MRKLATIQKIETLSPIPKADRLELVIIKGWQVVVQKGLHKVGDYVVFFEIDSFFKEGVEPYASQLHARGTKLCQLDTGEIISGYLIKSIKLRDQISQGYVVPLSEFDAETQKQLKKNLENDRDVSKLVNVIKFEKPESAAQREQRVRSQRPPKGKWNKVKWITLRTLEKLFPKFFKMFKFDDTFPHFISKTDCVRIQNYKEQMYQHYLDETEFQVTYKLDGSSITVYNHKGYLGICSRNIKKNPKVKTDTFIHNGTIIHKKINDRKNEYCIQGELISPKIQGNFEGVGFEQIHVYSIWDMKRQEYYSPDEVVKFCKDHDLTHVPILHERIKLKDLFPTVTNSDELLTALLKYADGPSGLNGKYREGLVYKACHDGYRSIKTISNKYLLKASDNED